jgi:hypothetical protein
MSAPAAKVCTGCDKLLPLDAFHRQASHWTGRTTRCKRCTSEAARAKRLAVPNRFQRAVERAVERRRSQAAAEAKAAADARLLAAVDEALERSASHSYRLSEKGTGLS